MQLLEKRKILKDTSFQAYIIPHSRANVAIAIDFIP